MVETKVRDQILSEIRRLAEANEGRPPGQRLFAKETGVAEHLWLGKIWARWGDALVDAGYEPNTRTERLNSTEVLELVANSCRHYGHFPSKAELGLYRTVEPKTPSSNAIARHFGRRPELLKALKDLASRDSRYSDLLAFIPLPEPEASQAPASSVHKREDGFVYLIKSGDHFKVGRSDDLERRVKEIRIAMPDKATLVHSIRTDDPAGIEAYWHRRFAEKRANGEWFRLATADISAFRKRKFQ